MLNLFPYTKPTTTLNTVEELKKQLNILHNLDNDFLEECLTQARDIVEKESGQIFTAQVWHQIEYGFCSCISIGKETPSTIAVKYFDSNNDEQTFNGYYFKFYPESKLLLKNDAEIPDIYDRIDPVFLVLTFTENPDATAKLLEKKIATALYENRGIETTEKLFEYIVGYNRLMNLIRKKVI